MMLTVTSSYARTYNQRVNDYLQAVENAKSKVRKFKEAVKSRDPVRIKKETLNIQEDPAAIKELNKESNSVKKKFVETTDSIQAKTIENIKKNYVEQYNAKHPEAKIRAKDVNVKKFTNPGSEIKAGHDWDVTVSVKGKDVSYREVKDMVHKSYFDAAGGEKAYPNSDPENFAKSHHVEVTSRHHAEAYEGGMDYINDTKGYKVKDPERLSKTIEYKSHLDQKNAAEYADDKEYGKSEVYKHEQARQYTKQYDKHIKPRIDKMGGYVPESVRSGTKILKKIGKYDAKLKRVYTPADADMDLSKMGETTESIIKKGSALVESGQKIKAPSKETRLKKRLREANKAIETAKKSGNTKKLRKAQNKAESTRQELKKIQSGEKFNSLSEEARLKKKLIDANEAVRSAKQSGNTKKLRKAQNKAARTRKELQKVKLEKSTKSKLSDASAKPGETLKGRIGRHAGEYMEGAAIMSQAQKAREGIKEGDAQKTKSAFLGEDTAKRTEGGKKYNSEMEKYDSAKKEEVISALTNKLKRMGASKEEIESFRKNYGKDSKKISRIIKSVKARGGKDTAARRPLSADGKMDDVMTKESRALEAAKQTGSYGKVILDMLSMGGVTRGDESKKDLSDIDKQSDRIFTETENRVIGKLYTELRDRGASKEEAREALKNFRNDRSGVHKLVSDLKERDPQKAKGSGRDREGLSVDNVDIEKDDDGWLTRIEETFEKAAKSTKEMLYDEPKKLVVGTAKDLLQVGKDIKAKSEIERYVEDKQRELKEQYDRKKKKLLALGATELEVAEALAGKQGSAGKLIKDLKKKQQEEKEKAARKEELAKKAKELMTQSKKKEREAEAKAARKRLEDKIAQSKKEELSAKAKALIAQAEKVDREEEEKATKKEELAKKAKNLMTQADAVDREAEAKAARKRLEDKIAQSKKEELSAKAKELLEQADESDKKLEIEAVEKKNEKKSYADMTTEERHKALKENSDEAWKGLEQDIVSGDPEKLTQALKDLSTHKKKGLTNQLVKDPGRTKTQEEKIAQLSGHISGGWSGKDKDGYKAKGSFRMYVSPSGKVTGKYSGDASGALHGFINSSGRMDIKLGGGSVNGGRWRGSVRKTESGGLVGSGSWSAEGYHGGWRGSGR